MGFCLIGLDLIAFGFGVSDFRPLFAGAMLTTTYGRSMISSEEATWKGGRRRPLMKPDDGEPVVDRLNR